MTLEIKQQQDIFNVLEHQKITIHLMCLKEVG